MVSSKIASRAASVLSNTTARDTLKRRHKPYKTEKSTILAKRRKLDVQTSYNKDLPPGYTFLAVGTPELAEFCKELSRKRNLPVNVVNAAPVSHWASDPSKVSHHIHRIGYHFRCEVVEEACEALGYVPYEGGFITIADLQKHQQNNITAQILAKHGVRWDRVVGNEETPDQVRAAIKELFPRIPQMDLDQIVTHAWEKGTQRVGSAADMTLARRVQLATIARIRHTYTDYETLLKSLGSWKDARKLVEPYSLEKLMEWRGESGSGQDDGLEEIVRETIVIDDDDDDDTDNGDDADDVSETSIEITHHPAALHDLRAEQANERDHRYFRRHEHPPRRTVADRTDIARQMIVAARNQPQNLPSMINPARGDPAVLPPAIPVNPQRIYIRPRDEPPQQVFVDGRWMQRVPISSNAPQRHAHPASPHVPHERPVQSIEREEDTRQLPYGQASRDTTAYYSRPVTPLTERQENQGRHLIDLTQDSPGYAQPFTGARRYHPVPRSHYAGEIVDLTSPRRQYADQPARQPQVIRVVSGEDRRHFAPIPVDSYGYPNEPRRTPKQEPGVHEYDPTRPLLDGHGGHNTEAPAHYSSPTQRTYHQGERAPIYRVTNTEKPPVMYTGNAAGSDYHSTYYPRPEPLSRGAPAPVHGAPAPVQQMVRELAYPPRLPLATEAPQMGQFAVRRTVSSPTYNGYATPVEHVAPNRDVPQPAYAGYPASANQHYYPR